SHWRPTWAAGLASAWAALCLWPEEDSTAPAPKAPSTGRLTWIGRRCPDACITRSWLDRRRRCPERPGAGGLGYFRLRHRGAAAGSPDAGRDGLQGHLRAPAAWHAAASDRGDPGRDVERDRAAGPRGGGVDQRLRTALGDLGLPGPGEHQRRERRGVRRAGRAAGRGAG